MNDRAVNLLEKYDVEVYKVRKGRGSFLCDTNRGLLIFKEYLGNVEKLSLEKSLLEHIRESKEVLVEEILLNKEEELFVKDFDDSVYILKTYMDGRECNINDSEECKDAMQFLAKLHSNMEFSSDSERAPFSPCAEYEKRNQEFKKIRSFLKKRGQKTWFEISLQKNLDYFLEQGIRLSSEWKEYEALRKVKGTFCHGDFQYHNLLKVQNDWFVINFEKCIEDDPIRDLYLFMRKLLEKSDWSVALGQDLLNSYEKNRPLSAISKIDLYYRLAYPEKFWKIANFYYNSPKAWIPEKNLEKLELVVAQEEKKQELLNILFREMKVS